MSAMLPEPEIMRILLIEDDEEDYILFKKLTARIDTFKCEIERAASFEAGLERLAAARFDVAIVDYRLGAHDGLELLREARNRRLSGPFIVLTGSTDRSTDMEALRLGASDYLLKTELSPASIDRALRYAVERERAAQALRKAHAELEATVEARTAELRETVKNLRRSEERERAARAEAERLYDEATKLNRLKDEFLASLSHELRTPLNSILGFSELLLAQEQPDPETAQGLEIILRNAKVQARLIEDLLDVSRIVAGKLTLRIEPVDLGRVVADAVDSLRVTADSRKVNLLLDLAHTTGITYGDPSRLQQIVWNLVSNAIKFTPENGRVTIRLINKGVTNVIEVSDNGEGIDPAFLPFVFERFRQQDGGSTRRHGGLGLGLAIVKHLVELHGGTIVAESAGPGKGSTFRITLPPLKPTEVPASALVSVPV